MKSEKSQWDRLRKEEQFGLSLLSLLSCYQLCTMGGEVGKKGKPKKERSGKGPGKEVQRASTGGSIQRPCREGFFFAHPMIYANLQ